MIQYKDKHFICHLDMAMEMIRGKWKAVILCMLKDGPTGFLELQRKCEGVSHKVLYEKLHQLEEDGLILRTSINVQPPRVAIELTALGAELQAVLFELEKWARKNF